MPTRTDPLLGCVRRIATQARPEPDDFDLLSRFQADGDSTAFEALVDRHGPMVLRVCRHVLGNRHDAEDAFQATFLVLARKAAGVRTSGCLAAWLHGVAYRVALGARTAARRRRRDSLTGVTPADPRPDPLSELTAREALQILEEEVQRLPKAYRLPVVLCCLHGLSQEEAARQLAWSPGSVKGRLERGRKQLHERLARRGLGLAAALAAAELSRGTAVALPGCLAASTARVAAAFASRGPAAVVPPRLAALAGASLRQPFAAKVRFGLLLVLVVGAVAAGWFTRAGQPQAARQPTPPAGTGPARTDRQADLLPEGAVRRFGSSRFRQGSVLRASALSPDGKVLATSGDHSVIVWDLDRQRVLRRFPCDNGCIFARAGLSFSPDGTRLGYVRGSFFACVWDVRTGKELRRFERRFEDRDKWLSNECWFAEGGREFAIVSAKAIEFWDVLSGELTASVRKTSWVGLSSPDGKTYLTFQEGRSGLMRCDTRTGTEVARWEVSVKHNGLEDGLAFSPDGKTVGAVDGKEVRLLDAGGGKALRSFPLPESTAYNVFGQQHREYRVVFSSDGKTLLLGTHGGWIHRWDCAAGKELPPLGRHQSAVAGIHTLPDGRTLVSTGQDGVIRRWDLATGREAVDPQAYEGGASSACSPDGRLVALADRRGRVDLWDGRNGNLLRTLQRDGPAATQLAFSPDGKLLAAAQNSGTVNLWQIPSGQPGAGWRHEPEKGEWSCDGVHFSPDGRRICVNDYPKQTRVIDVAGGELYRDRGTSHAEAFSPDGATLLVARTGPYLATLDAGSGKQLERIKLNLDLSERLGVMYHLAFSPDGRRLAVAVDGGTLMLCDGHTFAETHRLATGSVMQAREDRMFGRKLLNEVRALAFSPDGKWLAAAGSDTAVYLWEAATGKEVLRRDGHEAEVSTLAFSPDGRKVFSCGRDGECYVWDLHAKTAAGTRATPDALWSDLAGEDAARAHRAVRALCDDAGGVDFLRKKLPPAAAPDAARMAKLLADLDGDSFAAREEAGRELERLEEMATAPLRKALAGQPGPEARRRMEALLGPLNTEVSPSVLRAVRAVAALEYSDTPDARKLLETLARGAPESRLTREAKEALGRLSRRVP
jgi:RNA polymerase sigma factor (sigma-70 family)